MLSKQRLIIYLCSSTSWDLWQDIGQVPSCSWRLGWVVEHVLCLPWGGWRVVLGMERLAFCTVAAGWFHWDSPLLFSGSGVAVVAVMVPLGFLCSGGPLEVYGLDLLRIFPRFRGACLWLLTHAIA
ncbi:hypothetical protein AMECASPLE_033025 [Ameca splendens]|uniref:Uncharacterized protein n=1 Tax=Ameca splendens TaxID=208324 RepID=A0ABV0ZGN0_9TELE